MVKFLGEYSIRVFQSILYYYIFFRLLESGILQQWHRHVEYYHGKHFRTYKYDTNSIHLKGSQSLVLENIVSAFYLLLAGLFISFLVFIIEICIKYKRALLII